VDTSILCAYAEFKMPLPDAYTESTEARVNQFPLRLKDANGKVVGRIAWGGRDVATPFVFMQEGKEIFAVNVYLPGPKRTLFDFGGSDPVYYTTADCSGQAYLNVDSYWLLGARIATVLVPDDGRTLVFLGSEEASQVNALSARTRDFSCWPLPTDINGAPVVKTIDITGKFVAPFSIR
jgi:hypothetical protein